MQLSSEQRTAAILGILEVGLDFMSATFLSDEGEMGIVADQLVKSLLTGAAISGMFKEPELGRIYRAKNMPPTQKGIAIAKEFARATVMDPEFHSQNGPWVDEKLHFIYEGLRGIMMEAAQLPEAVQLPEAEEANEPAESIEHANPA